MADEGTAKENEGDKKVVHTYPLVKVNAILVRLKKIFDSVRSNIFVV